MHTKRPQNKRLYNECSITQRHDSQTQKKNIYKYIYIVFNHKYTRALIYVLYNYYTNYIQDSFRDDEGMNTRCGNLCVFVLCVTIHQNNRIQTEIHK